jgi:uncharacterized protein (DUF169 family)
MRSALVDALKLTYSPVAVVFAEEKPAGAVQFRPGRMGCVGAMLLAAARGRVAAFDRTTYGCPGGGTALGFGNCYEGFPIRNLLSTGGKVVVLGGRTFDMGEGERFHRTPEVTDKWIGTLPMRNVPAEYVLFKPLDHLTDADRTAAVLLLVNADQLSALITLADYGRGSGHSAIAPFGASCQSILFAYGEAESEHPRGVIGFLDISQRKRVSKDIMSFTVPYKMFLEMDANVPGSFLELEPWRELQQRQ